MWYVVFAICSSLLLCLSECVSVHRNVKWRVAKYEKSELCGWNVDKLERLVWGILATKEGSKKISSPHLKKTGEKGNQQQ